MATGSWTGTTPRGVYKPAMDEKEGTTTSGAWKNFDTSLTNVHNKLWRDNVINIKSDYSATGDGSTDDTTAIQNAINAAETNGGGIVFVPLGTYKCTSALEIQADDIQLVGEGFDSLLNFSAGIDNAGSGLITGYVHVYKADTLLKNIRISNLRIKGDKTKVDSSPTLTDQTPNAIALGQAGANPSGVAHSTIDHCWIEAHANNGIMITSGASQYGIENKILFNRIFDANGTGMATNSGNTTRAQIIGNTLYNFNGIAIEWSADGAIISNNTIREVENSGISTEANANQTLWSIIANNYIQDVGMMNGDATVGNGIQLGQTYGQKRVKVIGNTLRNCWGHGIIRTGTDGNCSNIIVVGNVVESFGRSGKTVSPDWSVGPIGIATRNTVNSVVRGNTVIAEGGDWAEGEGIDVAGSSRIRYGENDIVGTYSETPLLTGTSTEGQITETVTAASPTLNSWGSTEIDSSNNAVAATLGSGSYIGQIKTIVMTDATNASTVTVTNHNLSDGEVFDFDAVDDVLVLLWSGTEWITLGEEGIGRTWA
jgi:hypothetical protein